MNECSKPRMIDITRERCAGDFDFQKHLASNSKIEYIVRSCQCANDLAAECMEYARLIASNYGASVNIE